MRYKALRCCCSAHNKPKKKQPRQVLFFQKCNAEFTDKGSNALARYLDRLSRKGGAADRQVRLASNLCARPAPPRVSHHWLGDDLSIRTDHCHDSAPQTSRTQLTSSSSTANLCCCSSHDRAIPDEYTPGPLGAWRLQAHTSVQASLRYPLSTLRQAAYLARIRRVCGRRRVVRAPARALGAFPGPPLLHGRGLAGHSSVRCWRISFRFIRAPPCAVALASLCPAPLRLSITLFLSACHHTAGLQQSRQARFAGGSRGKPWPSGRRSARQTLAITRQNKGAAQGCTVHF